MPADTVDAGGRRIANGTITVDTSIGGISGISSSGGQTISHGYAGQLSQLSTGPVFRITASPPSLDETGTRQLAASFVTPDGMVTPVSASQVVWSVVSGPITSIDAGGLARAGVVYEDTIAIVRGVVPGASATYGLRVLNTLIDNFGSYAGDGIDDAWQVRYFGTNNPLAAPGADPDGDGLTNYLEYVAMTIPTNAASVFRVSIAPVPGQTNQVAIQFNPYSPQRFYQVLARPAVDQGTFSLINGVFTPLGSQATFIDTNATGARRYYRGVVSLPLP